MAHGHLCLLSAGLDGGRGDFEAGTYTQTDVLRESHSRNRHRSLRTRTMQTDNIGQRGAGTTDGGTFLINIADDKTIIRSHTERERRISKGNALYQSHTEQQAAKKHSLHNIMHFKFVFLLLQKS